VKVGIRAARPTCARPTRSRAACSCPPIERVRALAPILPNPVLQIPGVVQIGEPTWTDAVYIDGKLLPLPSDRRRSSTARRSTATESAATINGMSRSTAGRADR
jgi:hypothetical protein